MSRIDQPNRISRRAFVARSAAFASGLALGGPLTRVAAGIGTAFGLGSPELLPVRDETTGLPLLSLPRGFRYLTMGWTGDLQSDGSRTPPVHDGMAAFDVGGGRVRLIRNHEVNSAFGNIGGPVYDVRAGGGTTTLEFDAGSGRLLGSWPSLGGTIRNCAGGPTPWGSWLTCEETFVGPIGPLEERHGYVFEVPVAGEAEAIPLRGMGRFFHEAVAVDPATSIVYQTEDRGSAGFYRFVPDTPGVLRGGGRLQMLAIDGLPGYDTRLGQTVGRSHPVTWVDIDDPDPDLVFGVFLQGWSQGAAVFGRLEGAWWSDDAVFFVSTDGGDRREGQIWSYEPATERLTLVFESPSAGVLENPDNMCAGPGGGLVICEDGGGVDYLHWLTPRGGISRLARNDVVLNGERNGIFGDFRDSEFAGATFSRDGRWLFVNVQSPGITFAITGPWTRGPAGFSGPDSPGPE